MASDFCHSSIPEGALAIECAGVCLGRECLHGHGLGCRHRHVVWWRVSLVLIELDVLYQMY